LGSFMKGDIVVVPFPFSDLSESKKRPALVIANLEGDDQIICQITSQFNSDFSSISITNNDLSIGNLNKNPSNIRPNKIFTADDKIILYSIAKLNDNKMKEVIETIIKTIEN
jgi:mRNA interferase MazF